MRTRSVVVLVCLLCMSALFTLASCRRLSASGADGTVLDARAFGLHADGVTDDGPAILRMIEAARAREGEAVRIAFPPDKVIFAATGKERYLFPLQNTENLTVDGGGSTFLLDPHIRMVALDYAVNPVLKNFNVDYTVTMFIESVIEAVDSERRYVDVRVLEPGEAKRLGGPTKEDGEQWFGGFVWCENGAGPKAARHYAVKGAEPLGEDRARVFFSGKSISETIADNIKPGHIRFSLPRPGVAHRHGPGPLFNIHDTIDVHLENIAIWGAPWFACSVYRTKGTCRFINVDLVPKPDTNRLMAVCRDAYHVTGNRARLIFDGCDTGGLGDDDYNFCILGSIVLEVIAPTRIRIRQRFPIQYNPIREGETLLAATGTNEVLGAARILGLEELPLNDGTAIVPGGRCPQVVLTLDKPIPGLERDTNVWSKEAENPDTVLWNCNSRFGIRMQTSIKAVNCSFTNLVWGYGFWSGKDPNVEGPGPEFMEFDGCTFNLSRGSGCHVTVNGKGPLGKMRLQRLDIRNCTFTGALRVMRVRDLALKDNVFNNHVHIGGYANLDMSGNVKNGKPFAAEAISGARE